MYFLWDKAYGFNQFIIWHKLVEIKIEKLLKMFSIDRQGASRELNSYLKEHQIKTHLIVAHTREENGIKECKNYTVVKMQWSMLKWKVLILGRGS